MSIALLPGSYDPITFGHLDIIKRAAALYDEIVVAVMINDQKNYMFSMEERTEMVRLATAEMPFVRVISDKGLLIDLFDRIGADVIVKGVRNETDRAYEKEMAAWNLAHNERAETVLLQAADDFEELSSTYVRQGLREGRVPKGCVPAAVAAYLQGKGYAL